MGTISSEMDMSGGWRRGHDKITVTLREKKTTLLINERGDGLDEKEVKADLRGQWGQWDQRTGRDAIERHRRSDGNWMAKDERSLACSGS